MVRRVKLKGAHGRLVELGRAYSQRFNTKVPSSMSRAVARGEMPPEALASRIEQSLQEGRPDANWEQELATQQEGMLTMEAMADQQSHRDAQAQQSGGTTMLKGTKSYRGSAKPDDPIYTAGYVIGKPQSMVSHGNTQQNKAIFAAQDDNAVQESEKSTPSQENLATQAASMGLSTEELQRRVTQNNNFSRMITAEAIKNLKAAAAKAEKKKPPSR